MPRKRVRSKRSGVRNLAYSLSTGNYLFSLLIGWIAPRPDEVRMGDFLTLDEVREAWEACRDRIFSDEWQGQVGRRPWAWWQFDAPAPRDREVPEADQLRALGCLEAWEEEAISRFEAAKEARA